MPPICLYWQCPCNHARVGAFIYDIVLAFSKEMRVNWSARDVPGTGLAAMFARLSFKAVTGADGGLRPG